ncbi:uncharacterized protein [Taeniopygia guttata]|uniref:uncharacterized protein n=1 Tax=Taeniopygia guttata TaxID=59729 RepID=UPI003BB8E830
MAVGLRPARILLVQSLFPSIYKGLCGHTAGKSRVEAAGDQGEAGGARGRGSERDLGGGSGQRSGQGKARVTWRDTLGAGAARYPAVPFTGPLGARPSNDRHEFQRNHPPAAPPAASDRTGGTLTRPRLPGTRGPAEPRGGAGRGRGSPRASRGAAERPPRGSGARGGGGARPRPGAALRRGTPRAPRTRRGRGRFRGQTHEPEAEAAVGASGPNPARADLCGRRVGEEGEGVK